MLKRHLGFVQKAQGDPTGQPFGLGIIGPFAEPMVAGDTVGIRDEPFAQSPAHQG